MLVIDIGNTSIDLALWQENKYSARIAIRTESLDLDCLREWLAALPRSHQHAAVASVSGKVCEEVLKVYFECGWTTPLLLDPARHKIIPHGLLTPYSTGVDRLCAARAAWEAENKAVIIVDAGTAITIDAVDSNGVFLGGAILPGAGMWLRALHSETAQLPKLKENDEIFSASAQGRTTTEAIGAGLAYGLSGAVSNLVKAHREKVGLDAALIFTGGYAPQLQEYLEEPAKHYPDLVLDGIRFAAKSIMGWC